MPAECIAPMRAEEAVGKRLAYDVTIVEPGRKGALLRRGHVIGPEDVEKLLRTGHAVVYVYTECRPGQGPGEVHEDEAVEALALAAAGPNTSVKPMTEAKAAIVAEKRGLLRIDTQLLRWINLETEFRIAALRDSTTVNPGDVLAVVDLIPFTIPRRSLESYVSKLRASGGLARVKPFRPMSYGLVVTGTEVYKGLVEDEAGPVVEAKVALYGGRVAHKTIVPDDEDEIARAIAHAAQANDAVIVTGGMSVDPTDRTPAAIAKTGAEIVAYGIPIKPTTMTLVAYLAGKPIVAVSSGIIYFREYNALDVLLPRIAAGEKITREDIAELGHGGLSQAYLSKARPRR